LSATSKRFPYFSAIRRFKGHRPPKTVFLALLLALGASIVYFAIATAKLVQSEHARQGQLIDLTNAFTKVYSDERTQDAIVPAVFRRIGMHEFSANSDLMSNSKVASVSMRMPGVPGLELKTIETSATILQYIRGMARDKSSRGLKEFTLEDGKAIARRIVPSIASAESCVSCHNKLLDGDVYALGDVMGAFVVETDLTKPIRLNALFAVGAFFSVLFASLLVTKRENLRMQNVVNALTGRVKAESYANFLASHDSLTDLPNRKLFLERLDLDFAKFREKTCKNVIVAIVDVDDFKLVNDTMGHDVGDALLKEIGAKMSGLLTRYGGFTARLGGDEFAGVVTVCDGGLWPEDLGSDLLDVLCVLYECNGVSVYPKVSIGVSGLNDLDERGPTQLLKAADVALYASKRKGKFCASIFDDDLRNEFGRQTYLTSVLPRAINSGEIKAILQPQVDAKTHELVGFEALARWTHNGQSISPAEFIPLAEDTGLIGYLDVAVLKHAIALLRQLVTRSERGFRLSFNVSTKDLQTDDIVKNIGDVLCSSGFDPQLLTLEITESVFLEDWSSARRRLDQLKSLGLKIALDDFGTGYSALSYLTQFSFDVIKIDRSFLQQLDEDETRSILLSHVIKLATNLGKTVVAEGVERSDQAEMVAELGAHVLQGAHFGLNIDAVPELFLRSSVTHRMSA